MMGRLKIKMLYVDISVSNSVFHPPETGELLRERRHNDNLLLILLGPR